MLLRAGARGELDRALIRAATLDRTDLVVLLLEHGADPNFVGPYGTAMQRASIRGRSHNVRELLAAGADVNAVDSRGWTALTLG